MKMLQLFKNVFNKKFFFQNYAKSVTNWRQKAHGKNRNGNDITFTDADLKAIDEGIDGLFKELTQP